MTLESTPHLEIDASVNGIPQSVDGQDGSSRFTRGILYGYITNNPSSITSSEKIEDVLSMFDACNFSRMDKYTSDRISVPTYPSVKVPDIQKQFEQTPAASMKLNHFEKIVDSDHETFYELELPDSLRKEMQWEDYLTEAAQEAACSSTFSGSYIFVVHLDRIESTQNCIVKVSYRQPSPSVAKTRPKEKIARFFSSDSTFPKPLTCTQLLFLATRLNTSGERRYHFRVKSASSLKIVAIDPVYEDPYYVKVSDADEYSENNQKPQNYWHAKAGGSSYSIHDTSYEMQENNVGTDEHMQVLITFAPHSQTVYVKAILSLAIISILLSVSLSMKMNWIEYFTLAFAVSALVVALPRLFGASDEDQFTARCLGRLRALIGVNLTASVVTGTLCRFTYLNFPNSPRSGILKYCDIFDYRLLEFWTLLAWIIAVIFLLVSFSYVILDWIWHRQGFTKFRSDINPKPSETTKQAAT
ncbi:hypothetical protein [Corynebacterium variabile]|uniref:hypothetical protein n=1 Tax=Corynebacterium variabile TaxID=1727 RepID=UPI003A93F36D